MCFSATASFGVGAAIGGIGLLAVAQSKPRSHRMLAAVPLMFAGQQIAEGFVWSSIGRSGEGTENLIAVAAFLAFALVVWPLWVPLSLLMAEQDPRRRRILALLCCAGVAVAGYAAGMLLRGRPSAHLVGHSLAYSYVQIGPPLAPALYVPAYALPAVFPFFVSTISRAKTIGVVLSVALVATFVLDRRAFASVWCFFAAIISAMIVVGIRQDHRLALKVV